MLTVVCSWSIMVATAVVREIEGDKEKNMITPQQLADRFGRNLAIIKMQTDGLTHADCLLQPPFRGNCMNWVLGHIAAYRSTLLKLLGEEPVLGESEAARYANGSEPVTGEGPGVLALEKLLGAIEESQPRLAAGLQRLTPDQLAKQIEVRGATTTLAERLIHLYFHESYHTGQTELLRQLAGKNDKVI